MKNFILSETKAFLSISFSPFKPFFVAIVSLDNIKTKYKVQLIDENTYNRRRLKYPFFFNTRI